MYKLKFICLFFAVVNLQIAFSATENERKLSFLESLVSQGEYEEAILEGEKQLKKYGDKKEPNLSACIAASLLSRAYYHWYHFTESDRYYKLAFEHFNLITLDSEEKYMAGLAVAEAALQRCDYLEATKCFEITPKPNYKTTFKQRATYAIAKSKLNAAYGENFEAIKVLELCISLLPEQKDPEILTLEVALHIQKARALLDCGNMKEADTLRKETLAKMKDSKIGNETFVFDLTLLEADILFGKRNYYKAAIAYLKANHLIDGSNEEFRRFEALKMSAMASFKAGTVADYHKLFRRSDMLAFKKTIRSQAFRPGVMQLRLEELMETGQYSLALEKASQYSKNYAFLPSNNPYLRDFLMVKVNAAEAVGDFKLMASVLDTLEKFTLTNFTEKSTAFADIKLRKAELNSKYLGQFQSSIGEYANYFNGYVKYRISSAATTNIPYYNGQLNALSIGSKNDTLAYYARKALLNAIKAYGNNSPEAIYFESLMALGQFNIGEYKLSNESLKSATMRQIDQKDEENPYYLNAIFIQVELYEWLGEYAKVKELTNRANAISLRKNETKFYDQTNVAEAISKTYVLNGNFLKADKNLKFSIESKQKKLGENAFLLLNPYLQYTALKIQKGELKEADKYLQASEKVLNRYFKVPNSKFHIDFYLNKSRYYTSIADYKKGKEALLSAIDVTILIFGNGHIRLAPLYAELAKIAINENGANLDEAFNDFEIAKQIVQNSLGKETPIYNKLIVEQASLLILQGKFAMAEKSLLDAEKFWVAKQGNESQQLAEIYYIKGELYYAQRKYSDADKAYKKSSALYESVFNKRYIGYLNAETGSAKVAYMQKQYGEAAKILEPVLQQRLKFIEINFSIMSFGQKTGFWASFRDEFEIYNSIAAKLVSSKVQSNKSIEMYNFALSTKGLLLNSDARLRRQIFSSGDSTLIANFNEWMYQKEYYALTASYSKSQLESENISLEKIEQYIESLEKQIQAKADLNLNANSKKVVWQDVKKAIGRNSTAVEMVKFRHFDHVLTDSIIYASLIVDEKTNDMPKLVIMANGKKMEGRQLNYYRNASINKLEDLFSYEVFLTPLKESIPEGNTIYFAGEGVYTQLNPEMLLNPADNKYALESNSFVFLTSTKDAIVQEEKRSAAKATINNKFYLFGNPSFYVNKVMSAKNSIASLEGAENEVIEITNKLQSLGKDAVKMVGKVVTEDTIKAIENAYVLHIATHGYFMERKKTGAELINNPMLNSGLLLAGAGTLLQNPDLGYINQKPGVLTASEVMDLNFSKTKLVVLSACETGRGQVEIGEGVYGLQRAFLMAGANAIVLSLFKVDDEATKLLMLKFYEKFLTNGNDYRKAFREAKQELRNSKAFASPIYWGAFIMIEGVQHTKQGI